MIGKIHLELMNFNVQILLAGNIQFLLINHSVSTDVRNRISSQNVSFWFLISKRFLI